MKRWIVALGAAVAVALIAPGTQARDKSDPGRGARPQRAEAGRGPARTEAELGERMNANSVSVISGTPGGNRLPPPEPIKANRDTSLEFCISLYPHWHPRRVRPTPVAPRSAWRELLHRHTRMTSSTLWSARFMAGCRNASLTMCCQASEWGERLAPSLPNLGN